MSLRSRFPFRSTAGARVFALATTATQADETLEWREPGTRNTVAATATRRASDLLDAAARVTVQDRRELDREDRIGHGWYAAAFFISLDNAREGGGRGLHNLPLPPTPRATPRFSAGLAIGNLPVGEYDCFHGNATDATPAPGVPRPLRAELRYDF